jgi:hypothetical protein
MTIKAFLSAFLLSVSIIAAQAASPEEAAQIKAALQVYVGSEPGVVEVTPQGNGYAIKFDAAPYFAKAAGDDFKAYADPLTVTAEPMGNGQWKVAGSGPWGFQMSAPGKLELAIRAAEQNWTGIFDEAIGGFTSSESKLGGLSFAQKFTDPATNAPVGVTYTFQSLTSSSTAVADGAGGADSTTKMTMSGLNMVSFAEGGGNAAMNNYTVTAKSLTYDTSAKGLRMRALLDLLAWFVAHPAKDLIIRDQAQLKEKITAALPVFASATSSTTYDGINIATAVGPFALSNVGVGINMNGAVKDGFLQERIGFDGFTMPPGLVPPWTQELVPNKLTVDFSVAGFDLDTPVRAALAQLDLSKDPPLPPATAQTLLPALIPTNALAITIGASEITSPVYSLTYDGALNVSLAGLPTGKFNVKLKGMDAIMAKVQAAAPLDPQAQQAMGALIAAKGMGKVEADGTLSYAIDIQAMGQVFVNGVNVTAMAGGPPPPQPQQ